MKPLFLAFYRKLEETDMRFERYLKSQIDWNNRLIAITGARGTGKTTMLLQHIKEHYGNNPQDVLYMSLDNYFTKTDKRNYAVAGVSKIPAKWILPLLPRRY